MVSRDANELMTLPARSSNRGYDCARRRTTTTPRVTRENRPATTENYKTISGPNRPTPTGMAGKSRRTKITKQFRYGRRRKPRRRGGDHRSAHREWVGRRRSVGDPTDRHRRGWLASPDERKLQNNFDTGTGPVK